MRLPAENRLGASFSTPVSQASRRTARPQTGTDGPIHPHAEHQKPQGQRLPRGLAGYLPLAQTAERPENQHENNGLEIDHAPVAQFHRQAREDTQAEGCGPRPGATVNKKPKQDASDEGTKTGRRRTPTMLAKEREEPPSTSNEAAEDDAGNIQMEERAAARNKNRWKLPPKAQFRPAAGYAPPGTTAAVEIDEIDPRGCRDSAKGWRPATPAPEGKAQARPGYFSKSLARPGCVPVQLKRWRPCAVAARRKPRASLSCREKAWVTSA